jgi:glucose/arabinose dehydrogenase
MMKSLCLKLYLVIVVVLFTIVHAVATDTTKVTESKLHPNADNGGLKLQAGFAAITVMDSLARNRHLVVSNNGDIYVKLARLRDGKGIVVLREKANGRGEVVKSFANYPGTGIALKNGYLYSSSDSVVYRYKLNESGEVIAPDAPEIIVRGLVAGRQHQTKSIALDNAGNIYVNIGAPSNSCQEEDRGKGSKGKDPCPILDSAAGIWQFRADKLNQSYAEGVRYATGTRNIVGLDWNNTTNELYAMQHGRDNFYQNWPELYDSVESAELPAEEFLLVKKGSNFGWPYCYYDQIKKKKILAPEYGGNKISQGRCEGMDRPIIGFPGHWAPNALLFYTGNMFPEKYRNGAFIAFHGSWNRAPLKQKGYQVIFVPMKNGQPAGDWEVFADGFIGAPDIVAPREAQYRPCGLAQGRDGSLYISDSVKGKIWKIIYNGK